MTRRSTGRGAPLTGAKRTAAQPKCPFCPPKVMPPCSHTKPWFLLLSRGEMKPREPRGEGKREAREKGNPLAPSHSRPPIVLSCFCCFMGGVDPKLRIHFPPRHFPDCRDGGAVDKAWVFRTVRVPSSAKPARKCRQKRQTRRKNASKKGDKAIGVGMRGNTHRGHLLVQVALQRPSPQSFGG